MNGRGLRDADGDPDAYEIVEEFWPYDGPYSQWRTAAAATMVARLVRYLNNATQKQSAMPYASCAGQVLDGVTAAVFGLDQLCRQLAAFTAAKADDPTLYDDRADRPGRDTALELAIELQDMRAAIDQLARRLQRASGIASHLGQRE